MARRGRRAGRETRKWLLALGLGGAAVAVLAGILWLYYSASASQPKLAERTLCPETGPRSVTAIVIDRTDRVGPVTRADVRGRLQAYVRQVPRFGQLAIYGAGPDESDLLEPLFSRCNPGSGADAQSLTESPELVQRRFEREFQKPLETALEGALDIQGADRSPIMEGIQAVAVSAFPSGTEMLPRRLVVISDFLQNSQRYSMYNSGFATEDAVRAADDLRTDLEGVAVEMLMIGRDRDRVLQADVGFLDFWTRWFSENGAQVGRFVPLAGRN
jgi:hypothetical protein